MKYTNAPVSHHYNQRCWWSQLSHGSRGSQEQPPEADIQAGLGNLVGRGSLLAQADLGSHHSRVAGKDTLVAEDIHAAEEDIHAAEKGIQAVEEDTQAAAAGTQAAAADIPVAAADIPAAVGEDIQVAVGVLGRTAQEPRTLAPDRVVPELEVSEPEELGPEVLEQEVQP